MARVRRFFSHVRVGVVCLVVVIGAGVTLSARQDTTTLLALFLRDLRSGSIGGSQLWSALTLTKPAIATTSTDSLTVTNTTAATVGATVQMSPRTRWIGRGWDTDDAVSRSVSFFEEALPVTGNTVSGTWKLGYIDPVSAAVTYPLTVSSAGVVTTLSNMQAPNLIGNQILFDVSNQDVTLSRAVANRLDLATGDSFYMVSGGLGVGVVNTTAGSIQALSPQITSGAATGIALNNAGELREVVYKVTVTPAAFIAAAVTADATIATLPAKTQITAVLADLTQTFACTATCTSSTLSMVLGRGAGGAQFLASFDADASATQFGDADAEMGTTMTRAAAIQGGSFEAWASTQAVVLRLTSGTGNIGNGAATNLSQGSVTIYLVTRVMP